MRLPGATTLGLPARDPELAGQVLRADPGRRRVFPRRLYAEKIASWRKSRHIFYHVGKTLVELVEQRTEKGYPDYTNADGENMNPHFAFGTTVKGLAAFAEHLKREGVPFAGPRKHGKMISAASVYFRDIDGNILEVTTWEDTPDEMDRSGEAQGMACRLERT